MGRKSTRIEKAQVEIERLKARRRLDLIKMLGAITIMMLILLGKPMLESIGVMEEGNMFAGGVLWFTAIVLAVFAGAAGRDFSKCGRNIEETRTQAGL